MIEHGDADENMGVDGYEVGELGQGNMMQVVSRECGGPSVGGNHQPARMGIYRTMI